jgi:hypothetical protein
MFLVIVAIIIFGWGIYNFIWQCNLEEKQEELDKQEIALSERWEWYRNAMNDLMEHTNAKEREGRDNR